MKTYTLHTNQNSKELILFLSGFASHYSHYTHLQSQCNVILCYDYRDISLDIDMSQFEKVTLIAYSMGVCVASKICKDIQFHTTLAINGTNMGIDKLYGIHPILFNQTIKNFNLANFKKALFGNHISLAQNFFFDTTKSLIDELISLRNFCNETSEESGITWDKVLISKQDSIFPPQSCYNFFHLQKPQPIIIERNLVHYPFFSFQTWEEICMLHAS